jgi:hypothetical protein
MEDYSMERLFSIDKETKWKASALDLSGVAVPSQAPH